MRKLLAIIPTMGFIIFTYGLLAIALGVNFELPEFIILGALLAPIGFGIFVGGNYLDTTHKANYHQ